jgi:hypothetical protein
MTSSTEQISEEDLLSELSRDKALLISKVKRLEDTVVMLMTKHTRNVDTIKVQAGEIKDLSETVKCELRLNEFVAEL